MQLLADFIEQNFSKILRVDAELGRLSLHCSNAYSFKQECFQKVTTYFFNSIALLYCVRILRKLKICTIPPTPPTTELPLPPSEAVYQALAERKNPTLIY